MELQRMFVTLALKADEYRRGLDEAAGHAEGFRGKLSGIFSKVGTAVKLAMAGIAAAVAAGFAMAIKSSIDVNAQLETTELQFTTLMGSAEEARDHVAGLFEFAEKTPFETQPIIDASLKLQTFGGAALNTMENITLLGDAAAATNAPIDELGFWVGRLYGNLQAGQPFGEAAMRLQELAVMSPQARQGMEELQASGASAAEIFAYFQKDLEKFTGAMEKQAGTWQGMTSTIKDQISLVLAEAMRPFFDEGKEGLENIIALLNDPDIVQGIKNIGKNLGELATMASNAFGDIIAEVSALGFDDLNKELMTQLGFTALEIRQFYNEIRQEEGISLFGGGEEDLAIATAVNAALHERYAAELLVAQGIQARSEWEDFAREKEAALAAQMEATKVSAEGLDWALAQNAITIQTAALPATTDYATDLGIWNENAGIAYHQATLFGEALGYDADQARQAAADMQLFSDAFAGVVDLYTTALPGAGEPLVEAGGIVSIITGGLGAEGVALMGTYEESIRKLQGEIFNLSNGVGTYGMTQDEVNKKIADAQGELAHYQALIEPLAAQTGTLSTAQQGLSVNVGGVKQAVFDQLVDMRAAPEIVAAYGMAIGVMSEDQARAALAAAAVELQVEELARKIAEGMPVEEALSDLDDFIDKLENGVIPTTATTKEDVLRNMAEMHTGVAAEALATGTDMMTGLTTGVNDNKQAAIDATNLAAEDIINGANGIFGIESPSTVFAAIGGSLMEGLIQGVQDAVGSVITAMTTAGGDIVGGLVAGIEAAHGAVMAAISTLAGLIPDWLSQFLGANSPAKKTIPQGESIVEGVVRGIDNKMYILRESMEEIVDVVDEGLVPLDNLPASGIFGNPYGPPGTEFDVPFNEGVLKAAELLEKANQLNKVMSGFASIFQRRVLDPLQERLVETTETTEALSSGLSERLAELGLNMDTPHLYARLLRLIGGPSLPWEKAAAREALDMFDDLRAAQYERNQLEEEYLRQQEKLAALQKAQADLEFLNQQMALIALINENADILPPGFLDQFAIPFGLDADPGALMMAMVEVMELLVAQASAELSGGAGTVDIPDTDLDGVPFNVQNQYINGGQHIYIYDVEESELELLGVLAR